MNYNDQILENRAFNFFKQLMYNIALCICIMLVGVLVLVYGFKYKLYEVLSNSQAPEFYKGDMVVVKQASNYEIGDILTFQDGKILVTHRLIAIQEKNGIKTYYCHGDNVQPADKSLGEDPVHDWTLDSKYVQNLIDTTGTIGDSRNVQTVSEGQVIGKVVNHVNNFGYYFTFVKDHYMLLILLIAGIWCVSSVVQNEIDIKRTRRLL